ncbi:DUF4872 domain-containing protein [Dactylosporangium sp. NPDC005555]|uniref:BtrH N-terminal domain-containing protein n=1 Tax=Dactylosporangium sp. NPDC005555 TaxID=3154889 RepID=UPI0033B34FF3
MTDHKHLKRLVRERSARTGESYTTARRHILAARPAQLHHQPSGVVRELLLAAGFSLTEPMICGLGGGIGFLAAVFDYRGMPPVLTIVAQHHPAPWAPTVLTRLGIAFTEAHSTAAGPALKALRAFLAAGRPVYCTVSAARLPWHPTPVTAVDADPYGVLVTGESVDGFTVHDDAPHSLPVDAFTLAWSAHRKGRHHRLTVAPGTGGGVAAGVDLRPADLGAAIDSALAETAAHLTGPVLGNAFDANFGFTGMTRLAAQLRDTRTKSGFTRRFATPPAYASALRRVHECLEEQYTAPGATRPIYAAFLDEAATLTRRPRLATAATALRASGAIWSAMATTARESRDAEPATVFATLADLLDEARTIEASAVHLLHP